MLHPRLTPVGQTIGGLTSQWLATIGPYGSWGDIQVQTRWGDGASGMFEAQWTMPLPADFEHPLLRRGTAVELIDNGIRVGSPLIMSEPARGAGLENPWQIVAAGIGREVEGENSYHAQDGTTGDTTAIASIAVDRAIAAGWLIAGRDPSVPSSAIGGSATTDDLMSVGSLLNAVNDQYGARWWVNSQNVLTFGYDPTTPTYQVAPGAVTLGTSDQSYASTVYVRYNDASTGVFRSVVSDNANVRATFGRREYMVNLTDIGPISTATAQLFCDSILSRAKGRLAYTNGLAVTANEILTMGGRPADPAKVLEDVGGGCMVRLQGPSSDLLAYNGQTYIDVVMGEARWTDGAQVIDMNPIGLAARDLASVVESVTGYRGAA